MFDEKSLKTLEYDVILEQLATFAQSNGAKELAKALRPVNDLREAEDMLAYTAEADHVLFDISCSPSFEVVDINEAIGRVIKGATLSIPELIEVGRCLRISRNIIEKVTKVPNIPLLMSKVSLLYANKELEQIISDSFLSETEVSDNASSELRSIRIRIRKINENIKAKLNSYINSNTYSKMLSDGIVTVRQDRYVIPVKNEYRGQINGLVHDQSASGSTIYIEPTVVVELNNDLRQAQFDEQKEIDRILRNLTDRIRNFVEQLKWTYQNIVDLDLVFAKAQLAHSMKANRPSLNDNGYISIKEGRHPLIIAKKVVPVSLEVGKNSNRMLLITGPNTGGKTVTLKMVGLFVLMAASGLFIPAKTASISMYDGVFSDIGDEQSIEQSLSTFSAHMVNTCDIFKKVTEKSLVLFDELGSGTDPSEGAALAVSIVNYLLKINCVSLVTSHFNDLKEFALITPGVVTASMEFDIKTLSPTFKLVMNTIGSSNALDIASKLGLNPEIIEDARNRLSKEKKQFDSVIIAAEATRKKAEQLLQDTLDDREQAAKERENAEKEKEILKAKQETLNESMRKETKKLIEKSVLEAQDIIDDLKEILSKPVIQEKDLFEARALKSKLQNMAAEYEREPVNEVKTERDDSPLKVGDNVYVKSLDKVGVLTRLTPKGDGEVTLGKIHTKVKAGDFYKVKGKK